MFDNTAEVLDLRPQKDTKNMINYNEELTLQNYKLDKTSPLCLKWNFCEPMIAL